jgi:predicted glycosyltransferase
MKSELQVWILSGILGILLMILGFVLKIIAKYLGEKIEDAVKVTKDLSIQLTEITVQFKNHLEIHDKYQTTVSNIENRLRKLELDHAGHHKK